MQVITIDEATNDNITKDYIILLKHQHQGKVETDKPLLEALIQGTRACARTRGAHQATNDDVRAAVQIATSGLEHTTKNSNVTPYCLNTM